MLTTIANYHHSKLPAVGSTGYIIRGYERYTNKPLYWTGAKRLCEVIAYPLTDSPDYRFSVGVHTVYVQFLDNGAKVRFACQHFTPADWTGHCPEAPEH